MEFKKYDYSELDSVVFELKNDKAVIIPTDTVIGVLANNENLIYQIKDRPKEKKIILFVGNDSYLKNLSDIQKDFLKKFWPGQVTVIKDGVSYRMPDDKYLLYILNKTGPLYSSSANVSGHDTIQNTLEANKEFNVDKFYYSLVLVEGITQKTTPSTVVNIDTWEILREGCRIDEVKEFINLIHERKDHFTLLIDEESIKIGLKIKEILDSQKTHINLEVLNEETLEKLTNSIRDSYATDGFIVTQNPLDWDSLANKQELIRSALIYNEDVAYLSKKHDNSNIALFDLNQYDANEIAALIKIYLSTEFEGGRHEKRVQTIIDYELENKN